MVRGVEVELAEIATWGAGAVATWGAYSQIRLVERDWLNVRFGTFVDPVRLCPLCPDSDIARHHRYPFRVRFASHSVKVNGFALIAALTIGPYAVGDR
jgi:hypothetical protein